MIPFKVLSHKSFPFTLIRRRKNVMTKNNNGHEKSAVFALLYKLQNRKKVEIVGFKSRILQKNTIKYFAL